MAWRASEFLLHSIFINFLQKLLVGVNSKKIFVIYLWYYIRKVLYNIYFINLSIKNFKGQVTANFILTDIRPVEHFSLMEMISLLWSTFKSLYFSYLMRYASYIFFFLYSFRLYFHILKKLETSILAKIVLDEYIINHFHAN